jgi:hypothetical protein
VTTPIFVRVAADPTLVAGIYNACDQWCMYCPATARCLAYRCNPEIEDGKQDIYGNLADRLQEGMVFLKGRCDAEGIQIPELDTILADFGAPPAPVRIDDPLERMGRRYAHLSTAYLNSRADVPTEMRPRPSGPTPLEVVVWFHLRIATKLYRALVTSRQAARGDESLAVDAAISAKIALIGIDRSLDALAAIAADSEDPRLELLLPQRAPHRPPRPRRTYVAAAFRRPFGRPGGEVIAQELPCHIVAG